MGSAVTDRSVKNDPGHVGVVLCMPIRRATHSR